MTTPIGEQRFKCECGKSWTGFKMEHCKVCHETFNNTKAGDKHTVVAFTYAVVRDPFQGLVHISDPEQIKWAILGGCSIVSEHNEQLRCLTAAEMLAKGMNQEKNGAWNMGGRAYIPSQPVG